ncbi:MAG TPA: L-aspartate oxidase [Oligoflexia bacterium]|nr:L-aspartate oxidase [Oligoflexia bacterium]HMR23957.1 L-aspartate oxidase [Oligoflexia bacterium]
MKDLIEKTDVLIIGTGLSACTTAFSLLEENPNIQITMLSSARDLDYSASAWAQGGIVYKNPNEQSSDLVKDILNAGAGLSNPIAANILAEEGPELTQHILLDTLKVPFEKDDGDYKLTEEAAHSFPRILYCADQTGLSIQTHFLQYLKQHKNIRLLNSHTAIDLLTPSHHSTNQLDRYAAQKCVGAYVFDEQAQRVKTILSHHTVLATGGLGRLFLNTTNPKLSRGDGVAMAYRLGARVMNLEFIQFHPTAFYKKGSKKFLISETLRGEGGVLIDHAGYAFMKDYHSLADLAPRDIVARSIHNEMLKQNVNNVYLDISHKDEKWLKNRFPYIYEKCLMQGINISKDPIPVVPAAHYSCGGVYTNENAQTSIEQLWAVGETACTGLHGANRLASTSLLENIVFGYRGGKAIAEKLKHPSEHFDHIAEWKNGDIVIEDELLVQDWISIQHTMWNYVGLVRTPQRLDRAQGIIRTLSDDIAKFYANGKLTQNLLALRNAITVAQLIVTAAQRNKYSQGCHYLKNQK